MTGLSVVVANRSEHVADVVRATRAIDSELEPDTDQLVWVDRAGLAPPPMRVSADIVTAAVDADRGACYGLGAAAADRPLVAFTDSATVVQPGWRNALVAGLEAGALLVGGPVEPGPMRSVVDRAGFLVDYAVHAVPPYTSASGDVAGNNMACRRELLPPGGAPIWKSDIARALRDRGSAPTLVEGMRAALAWHRGWSGLGAARLQSGALYGSRRGRSWPVARRVLAAAGCLALPALAVTRLWLSVRADRRLRRWFVVCLPLVAYAAVAWSAGEAAGYVRLLEGRGVW
ncbi:MAG TPA: hypothetical protein VFO60_12470 [Candidatus Dormibacteraeota bacterium]|nr:hypothetical protein [Candidatus Dormibacteraeota bacterium]